MKFIHKEIFESLSGVQLMGLCIEREAGGEGYDGRVCVGTVVLERVDHRDWDGKTIHAVILKPWQFSWTMPEAGEPYYNEAVQMASDFEAECQKRTALKECYKIAEGMLVGTIPRDPELAAAHCCEYVETRARKYLDAHPEIKANRWWQRMKLLKTVKHHEFYVTK